VQEKLKQKQKWRKRKSKREKKKESGKQSQNKTSKQNGDMGGVPHKGPYAQLPKKMEQAGMCLVQDALLFH
jgi:hypothetical protein